MVEHITKLNCLQIFTYKWQIFKNMHDIGVTKEIRLGGLSSPKIYSSPFDMISFKPILDFTNNFNVIHFMLIHTNL